MKRQQGLSYIEVTLAAVVLGVGLVPVLQSMQGAAATADAHALLATENAALVSRLDWVKNQSFSALLEHAADAGSADVVISAYSDAAGASPQIDVFLSAYDAADDDGDGDPFTINDPNHDGDGSVYTATLPSDLLRLLWLKVQIAGSGRAMTTLVRR